MADGFSQQPQFPTVQQLQDSSTLESQALSSSYHSQNLLHVPSTEVPAPIIFIALTVFVLLSPPV